MVIILQKFAHTPLPPLCLCLCLCLFLRTLDLAGLRLTPGSDPASSNADPSSTTSARSNCGLTRIDCTSRRPRPGEGLLGAEGSLSRDDEKEVLENKLSGLIFLIFNKWYPQRVFPHRVTLLVILVHLVLVDVLVTAGCCGCCLRWSPKFVWNGSSRACVGSGCCR